MRAWRPLKPTGVEGVVEGEEGGRRMRDATRGVDEEGLRGARARRGNASGVRRVSIQLPRISSGRGDSPPRICHLRGRDCPRIPECRRVFRNITTIYTRVLFRARWGEKKKESGRAGLFIPAATPDESRVISRYRAISFRVFSGDDRGAICAQ